MKRTSAFLLLTASLAQITLRLIPISREAIPGISGVWAANMMAQELSAWFVVVNLIGLALSLRWSKVMSVIFSAAALFSIYPFFLVPGVNHEMARQWEETGMNPARVAPPGAVSVFLQSFSSLTDSAAHSEVEAFTNPIVYYLPTRINAAASPIVIDLHGGSWQHGSPKEDEALSQHLAAQGYSVFAVDYRRAPLHRHPAQIEDVRQAIGWIKSNAKRLHADASRIALIGHSAGAHLAMLAAFAEPDTAIRAVVSFYGPADLNALYLHPPSPDPLNVPALPQLRLIPSGALILPTKAQIGDLFMALVPSDPNGAGGPEAASLFICTNFVGGTPFWQQVQLGPAFSGGSRLG